MVLGFEDRVLQVFNFDVSPETVPDIRRHFKTLRSEVQQLYFA